VATDPAEQGNQDGEAQRPEWLPENFDSPESFAASYKEAQRKITEETTARKALEQNYADLSSEIEQLRAQFQQPQQPQYDANDIAAQYGLEPEQLQLMAQLANEAADMRMKQFQQSSQPIQESQASLVASYARNEVAGKYPDFVQHAEGIANLFQEKPWLYPEDAVTSPQKAVDAIETAYNLVKYQSINSQAAQENTTAEQLMERMKLQAQSAQGADGRPAPVDPLENRWAEIQNAPTRSYADVARQITGR